VIFFFQPHLRSPTWVMNFQRGNSFECATLLVGLLLGQSYNAVVVSGYASREQILCDLSKRPCPYLPEQEKQTSSLPSSIDVSEIFKYQLIPPLDFRSQLLLELEERKKSKKIDELRLLEEERQKKIADYERPKPDKYFGHRIHAWVAILPGDKGMRNQEIIEPIFIEPSSGISYRLVGDEINLLYLGVESVWNDKNYWVNMQPRVNGCAKIDWDLSNTQFWEHLLPGEPWTAPNDTEMAEEDIIEQNKHLDMPASYVSEIRIHNIDFERRYPNGNKTIFYKKAKVELFAPYVRTDGLVRRVTIYEDYQYTSPVRCYEKYLNRSDCLVESTRDVGTSIITDSFDKSRPDHCKAHRYLAHSIDAIDSERMIDFYDNARFDGLLRIEIDPFHLTQHYVDREDFLYYRHAEFSTDTSDSTIDNIHFRRITKMVEKYHRDEKIPAYRDIAIREFMMIENEIRVKFHYNKGQSTRAARTFVKPSIADRGDRLVFDSNMIRGYHPNPTAPPEKNIDIFYEFDKHLKDEDHSMSCIRDAESEVASFLKERADENLNLQLTVSLFDRDRAVDIAAVELGTEDPRYPSQGDFARELNPLGPYLARIGNPSRISKAEAYLLRDECLDDFKRSTVEKANRILLAIRERAAELEKLQATLTQTTELPKTEEERILAKINEVGFDLYLLETYLNRHRESTSSRYRVLVGHLQENPHIQSLDTKH
ncbi:dynein regulatory complex subunit 7, partial [Harpegnathos saltator]|uniref:dynein regulatory complex subunit 7 n=1 Tax=Harpegnathos saltator TaxID=610380 RepID=UPI000DBEE06B